MRIHQSTQQIRFLTIHEVLICEDFRKHITKLLNQVPSQKKPHTPGKSKGVCSGADFLDLMQRTIDPLHGSFFTPGEAQPFFFQEVDEVFACRKTLNNYKRRFPVPPNPEMAHYIVETLRVLFPEEFVEWPAGTREFQLAYLYRRCPHFQSATLPKPYRDFPRPKPTIH